MGAMNDLQTACAAQPSEDTVAAALRAADMFRRIADFHLSEVKRLKAELAQASTTGALAKAALVDHALNFEGSSLVLVRMRITAAGQWTTEPVVDLEHARKIMAADMEQPDDSCDCQACSGTGEGRHEGASCAVCGGMG